MNNTPETDAAERESIAAYIEVYGPNSMFPCDGYDLARKLERERDEAIQARKQSAAEWLEITTLADNRSTRAKRERDDARERADTMFAKHADILDNARSEREVALQCHRWVYEEHKRTIKELIAVTEQRDRLAEALRNIRAGYGGQIAAPNCCEDCDFLIPIDEAIQYLTTNEL